MILRFNVLSIVKLIENHSSLNLIAEYSSALETKNGLNTHKVDLIFLDIEMPVLNGFELLRCTQQQTPNYFCYR